MAALSASCSSLATDSRPCSYSTSRPPGPSPPPACGRQLVPPAGCRRQQQLRRDAQHSRSRHPLTCRGFLKGPGGDGGDKGGKEPSRPPKGPGRGKPPPPSAIEQFIKSSPVLSRVQDGTLIFGDIVMILATEVSSERIPYESMGVLVGVMAGCWVAVAAAMGDYKGSTPTSDSLYISMLGPAFLAVLNATMTWAVSMMAAIAVYAFLVANNMLDAAPVVENLGEDDLSPQLEVVVALLITMSCWRGIACKLRN